MRTSLSIRGVLAVAAVTAGAGWLGMGSALAATPAETRPHTTSTAADVAPNSVNGLRLPSLRVSGRDGYGYRDGGDLLVGIEQIGRSSGMPTRTTTVVGLTDLPAIVRSTGIPRALRGQNVYDATRGGGLSHVLRREDPPVPGEEAGLDTPAVDPEQSLDVTQGLDPEQSLGSATGADATQGLDATGLNAAPGLDAPQGTGPAPAIFVLPVEPQTPAIVRPGADGTVVTAEIPSLGTSLRDLRVR
ncbi:hypothetical protein AB0B89_23990 [Sphaerisporangium sp. NPDC049002]|uniref:hypothetical protein n=1 Tax=unclassified Sphaerisporangium TaxID=2630420 RepID=UPI0033DA3B06